jgi:methylamine dehydrogenase accessory protein MauD
MNGIWLMSYICLWLLMIAVIVVILALARQVGFLNLRLRPMGARMVNAGPTIGDQVPDVSGPDLEGHIVRLGGRRSKQLLVICVSATCSSCDILAPALRSLYRRERERLDFLIIGLMGDVETNRAFANRLNLNGIPFVVSREIGVRYGILSPPYGLLIDQDGVLRAKGIVNHLEHLESLINAGSIPDGLHKDNVNDRNGVGAVSVT